MSRIRSGGRHYRTLFHNNSADSAKAIAMLKKKRIRFSHAVVGSSSREWLEEDLPCLITDEGRFKGLDSIQRYARTR